MVGQTVVFMSAARAAGVVGYNNKGGAAAPPLWMPICRLGAGQVNPWASRLLLARGLGLSFQRNAKLRGGFIIDAAGDWKTVILLKRTYGFSRAVIHHAVNGAGFITFRL